MLGFFRSSQEVVAVSLMENLVGFVSAKKLTPGKTVKLKLLINTNEGTEFFTSSATVAEVEAKPEGGFLCSAILKCKSGELATLTQIATRAGLEGACRRRSARLDYGTRAISKQLPNFRAVTLNINLSGALILCDGPVEPGMLLVLQFNLENVDMGELTVEAESVWTDREPFDGKSYRVGIVLTPQPKRILDIWTTLYSAVSSVEGGNVMQRTMGNPTAPPGSNINQSRHTPQQGFVAPTSPGGSSPQQPDPYKSGGYTAPASPQSGFTPPAPANPYASGGFTPPAPGNPYTSGGYTAPPVSPSQNTPSFKPPGQPSSAPSLNFGNPREQAPQFNAPNFSSQEPAPPPQQSAQSGKRRALSLGEPDSGHVQSSPSHHTGFTSSNSLNFSSGQNSFTPPPPPKANRGPGITPPSPPGAGFSPPTPPQAPGVGFTPPPPPGSPGAGFTPPPAPGPGFTPPPPPGGIGSGFTPPPPPGGGFKPPNLPGGQSTGFTPPPPPPGGFQPPPPPKG